MKTLKIGLGIALLVILLDQATKILALGILENSKGISVIPNFFDLTLAWNRGVSFSLLSSHSEMMPWILSGITLVIVICLLVWLCTVTSTLIAASLGLIIGGAVGNLIDRLRFGAVIDFLDFSIAGYHWPTFNIADTAVCIGVGLILLDSWIVNRYKGINEHR